MAEKTKEKPSEPVEVRKIRVPSETAKGVFVHTFGAGCIKIGEESHFILDGTFRMPPGNEDLLVTRLIMSPQTIKLLMKLLEKTIGDYEKEHGKIKLPEYSIGGTKE
jgi:hypothetical protein